MSDIYPAQVISQDALRWINFFNGRLLTGDDLTREQAANRDARQRLGQVLGDGVAWGLLVQAMPGDIALKVGAGEAVNRQGQVLYLGESQSVSLLQAPRSTGATRPRQFNACELANSGTYGNDAGFYLLTLCPAESVEDRAALSGLSSAAAACNSKYRVDGVQFKLILLPSFGDSSDPRFRNQAAFEAFIDADMAALSLEEPFSPPAVSHGSLDGLRPDPLTDEDVPLAVILRDPQGIAYVDNWSVRRRLRINANEPYFPWHLFVSDRRAGEAEAAFMQFQEQLTDILRYESGAVSNMSAKDRFKYLPPVGFLPIGGNFGFDWKKFLGSHAPAQATKVDVGVLDKILLEGLKYQPLPVETSPLAPLDVFITEDDSFVLFARTADGRLRMEIDAEVGRIDEETSEKTAAELEAELARLRKELDRTIDRAEEKANDAAGNDDEEKKALLMQQEKMDERRDEQVVDDTAAKSRYEGKKLDVSQALKDAFEGQKGLSGKWSSQGVFLTIYSPDSNLEIRVVADEDGNLISPDLSPGTYRIIGRLAGLGYFARGNVEIVGGQISPSYIPASLLKPGDLYLDAGLFRLCLIPGTFTDAAKQAATMPWMRMAEIGGTKRGKYSNDVGKLREYAIASNGILKTDILIRLILWRQMLKVRFPDLDIQAALPKLFVNGEYNLPNPDQPTSRKLQNLPEVPQAYVVFGDLGLPLTIVQKKTSALTLQADAKDLLQSDKTLFRDLTLYGMLTVDQIAGAWVQVIVEATGLTSRNARIQINRAIQYLAKQNA